MDTHVYIYIWYDIAHIQYIQCTHWKNTGHPPGHGPRRHHRLVGARGSPSGEGRPARGRGPKKPHVTVDVHRRWPPSEDMSFIMCIQVRLAKGGEKKRMHVYNGGGGQGQVNLNTCSHTESWETQHQTGKSADGPNDQAKAMSSAPEMCVVMWCVHMCCAIYIYIYIYICLHVLQSRSKLPSRPILS